MNEDRIKYLLKVYAENISTQEEVAELFALVQQDEADEQLKNLVIEQAAGSANEIELAQDKSERVWNNIHAATLQNVPKKDVAVMFPKRYMVAAAATVILIVTVGIFFTGNKKKDRVPAVVNSSTNNDIKPGGNKATLTLADGSVIILDTAQNGFLTNQNNTKIIKLSSGLLSYKKGGTSDGRVMYNTITTPRGGQYQLELPDGTVVWLNAASSLVFPTSFAGKERKVELKGEGYFEVAKNTAMPFHVVVNNMDVKVLGTHFNIMSYPDEDFVNTTLLEGSINLSANGITKNLQPGKQALVDKKTNAIELGNANIKQAVAWKNGEFRFKETGIKEVMRQIGRWYDVEVEYQTNSANQYFTASLPRMQNASALLQTLELTGTVHFKIDNKKIIVLP